MQVPSLRDMERAASPSRSLALERVTEAELAAQRPWLSELARSLTGDGDDAADLVQETLVVAWSTPPSRVQSLRPWLAGTARHLFWRQLRTKGRRARRETWASSADEPFAVDATGLMELEERERDVMRALAHVREPYRSTLRARFVEGHTSADIARRAQIAEATVRWRTKMGIAELRRLLGLDAPRRAGHA